MTPVRVRLALRAPDGWYRGTKVVTDESRSPERAVFAPAWGRLRWLLLTVFVLSSFGAGAPASAAERLALVIGDVTGDDVEPALRESMPLDAVLRSLDGEVSARDDLERLERGQLGR